MKNFTMALALLAVLGLAGLSAAETVYYPDVVVANPQMHLVVSDPVPLNYGLLQYTVTAYSDVNPINTISVCNIEGLVHQVWPMTNDDPVEYANTIWKGSGATWNSAWAAYDTYRLYKGSPLYTDLNGNWVGPAETNAGGAAYSGDFVKIYPAKVGMGTLTGGNGGTDTFTGTAVAKAFPIVQIVIPSGTSVRLTVRTVDDKQNSGQYTGVLIPEPSTIVMLVMGAVCLVGYRLRKK